jgi:hypothetical protein
MWPCRDANACYIARLRRLDNFLASPRIMSALPRTS